MIDDMSDMSHIYGTKLALVSPNGDLSLLDNLECEMSVRLHTVWTCLEYIDVELHWLFGLCSSVCATSAALSPPPQRSRRESGAITCPALVLRLGGAETSQEDLGMTGRRTW